MSSNLAQIRPTRTAMIYADKREGHDEINRCFFFSRFGEKKLLKRAFQKEDLDNFRIIKSAQVEVR